MSIDGNRALIGAYSHEVDGDTNAGAVYLFTRDATTGNWSELQKIVATPAVTGGKFGYYVDMDGTNAIISNTHSAYIIEP